MFKSYFVDIGEHKIKVGEWEGNSDKTILAIHGLTGNLNHFAALAEALSPEFRFLAYDIRGRGDSSPADEESGVFKHADDAIALIKELKLEKPILVGHSFGGYVALIAASKCDNLSGLVLLDSGGIIIPEMIDVALESIAPALARLDIVFISEDEYIEGVKPNYASMGLKWNKYIEQSARYELGQNKEGAFKFKGESSKILMDFKSCVDFVHQEICPKIKCPVILFWASGDSGSGDGPMYPEFVYEITKEFMPNLQYCVSPGNHYSILLESRPEVADEIRKLAGAGNN